MSKITSSVLVAALLLAGCQEQQIATYTAPREQIGKKSGSAGPQRLLAAMFTLPGGAAWTFRLDGPVEEVNRHAEEFDVLTQSVRFAGPNEPPTWTMPEGWTRAAGSQFRYATLRVGKLEGRVSQTIGDQAAAVLPNLTRYHGEVGLPAATDADAEKETRPIEVNGVKGTWYDMTGPGGKGGGPMMKF